MRIWALSQEDELDLQLRAAAAQIDGKKYDDALRTLNHLIPSEFGKREYLVHYTIGRAAEIQGLERVSTNGAPVGMFFERLWNDKDYRLAEKLFRKSIELNPGFSPAYDHLVLMYSSVKKRSAEAFAVADALVKLVSRCTTAYKWRGGCHSQLNRHLDALADFETAAELGPNNPGTYYLIGEQYFDLKEDAKAVEAYETAIRLGEKDFQWCHYNIGLAYQRMGKFEQALTYFEKAKSFGSLRQDCDERIAECRKRLKYRSAVPERSNWARSWWFGGRSHFAVS